MNYIVSTAKSVKLPIGTRSFATAYVKMNGRDMRTSSHERLTKDSGNAYLNTLADGTDIWLPKTCGFIGGGTICEALLLGFFRKNVFNKANVVVTDVDEARLNFMHDKFGVVCTNSNTNLLKELKIVVLAVKTQILDDVL